ncbi:hypothetical protein EYF80_041410 [Liparis tanakae]|uniref:Uncharacterized protein n=1 Tax=Liparis tanakae TaxID=230148 RepID=A0A4Z2G734_9TELE|nr:hypothetical protein EYF80_041410 [Liparis tanakae]
MRTSWPKRYSVVMRSLHWTSSPSGPPLKAFSAILKPDSLVSRPKCTRTWWKGGEEELTADAGGNADRNNAGFVVEKTSTSFCLEASERTAPTHGSAMRLILSIIQRNSSRCDITRYSSSKLVRTSACTRELKRQTRHD